MLAFGITDFFTIAGGDIEGFPFVPWLGFAYNFGKKY